MANPSSFEDNLFITGSSFHVDLAPLDARHPVHYSRRLLIFRCHSSAQRDAQLAALKTGLQALVSHCPILGGMIVPLPPEEARNGNEDWRTIVPGQGLELIVRDLSAAMVSFTKLEATDFPSEDLPYHLLVPVPADLGNDRPFAACKVQFSAINGGTILTFSMSHSVADGSGTNELMRILSEETRLAPKNGKDPALLVTATKLGLDRSILRNMTSKLLFNITEHPAYVFSTPLPAPPGDERSPPPLSATRPEIPIILHIPPVRLNQLKADATPPAGPPISTHDALGALLWRSVLYIRSRRSPITLVPAPSTVKTHLFLPSDARRHLPLPAPYIGNAVYQLAVSLDLSILLSPGGLQAAAAALRGAVLAVQPEHVASYMAELREKWVGWAFMDGNLDTTGVAMGTDWTSGMVYHDACGWGEAFGPLVRYRYPGERGVAFHNVLPKLADGSAEVMVGVMPEEVEILRGEECFGKYLA